MELGWSERFGLKRLEKTKPALVAGFVLLGRQDFGLRHALAVYPRELSVMPCEQHAN
jgi:hypothetical protein